MFFGIQQSDTSHKSHGFDYRTELANWSRREQQTTDDNLTIVVRWVAASVTYSSWEIQTNVLPLVTCLHIKNNEGAVLLDR